MTETPTIEIVRLTAAVAEVLLHVDAAALPADCELRGRLMGPRRPGVQTIEVAYPLKPLPVDATHPHRRSARVIIPDPVFWEADRPTVYWGPVEIWSAGVSIAGESVSVGIKPPT